MDGCTHPWMGVPTLDGCTHPWMGVPVAGPCTMTVWLARVPWTRVPWTRVPRPVNPWTRVPRPVEPRMCVCGMVGTLTVACPCMVHPCRYTGTGAPYRAPPSWLHERRGRRVRMAHQARSWIETGIATTFGGKTTNLEVNLPLNSGLLGPNNGRKPLNLVKLRQNRVFRPLLHGKATFRVINGQNETSRVGKFSKIHWILLNFTLKWVIFCPILRSFRTLLSLILRGFGVLRFCLIIQEGTGAKIPLSILFRPIHNPTQGSMKCRKPLILVVFSGFP